MIITCPACSTRYLIDPRSLGVTGRTVRCTQCSHTWVQVPPEDAPRRVDLAPPDVPPPGPRPRALAGPVAVAMTPSPTTMAQRPQDRPERRSGGLLAPLVFVLIILLAAGFAWYQRDMLIARFPALEPVYGALGYNPSEDARNDLEFRKVSSNREEANGHSTLVIQGEVANPSRLAHRVPRLRVTLQDANKKPLRSWTLIATNDRLLPGAAIPFSTSVQDPSDDTAGAVVTFDGGE